MLTPDVVVCTRERPAELAVCLESLARQTTPPRCVIVVHAGVPASGGAVVPGLDVRHVSCEPGLPRQRNRGLELTDATLVTFLDDDVELEPKYLEAVIRFLDDHPGCVGVSGAITNDPIGRPLLSRWYRAAFDLAADDGRVRRSGDIAYLRHPDAPTQVEVLSGANMTYRREALDGIRFRENLGRYAYMEDADVAWQVAARGELWMLDGARLVHHRSPVARIPRGAYVEEVLVNSTRLFFAHRKRLALSTPAFVRRLIGRAGAYLAMAVVHRSPQIAGGVARGLRRSAQLLRSGRAEV